MAADEAIEATDTATSAVVPAEIAAWMTTMAALLELPVPEEYRAGVAANLQSATKMAGLLVQVDLPDDLEAAPVFRA